MNRQFVRYALAIIVALFAIVPAYLFLEWTPIYIAWVIIWACCFAFLVNSSSLLVRGFLFLTSSLALGLIGLAYAKGIETELLWAVEFISQVIILVGSGVGGNYIATHYLRRHRDD